MEVGFTTTYSISAYHHWCCEFESPSRRGVQHYVIKFVSYLWQVGGFLRVLNKTYRHDITEILFKVALNTIKKTHQTSIKVKYNNNIWQDIEGQWWIKYWINNIYRSLPVYNFSRQSIVPHTFFDRHVKMVVVRIP
jgi:hypothetical protein